MQLPSKLVIRIDLLPAVPRKWFRSADGDTTYTIYLSHCTHTAGPFQDTNCIFNNATVC